MSKECPAYSANQKYPHSNKSNNCILTQTVTRPGQTDTELIELDGIIDSASND